MTYIRSALTALEAIDSLQDQINQKANASTVDGLAAVISGKASQSDVTALAGAVAGKADAAALSAKADASALSAKADKSDLSGVLKTSDLATEAPPAVANDSAVGDAMKPSRSDHTHKSSLNATRIQVAGVAGKAVWTFATPYAVGQKPVVDVTAETPDGASYVNIATIQENSITNTSVTIVVQRVVKTVTLSGVLTSLLGSILTLFNLAPSGVFVNATARIPNP